MCYTVMVKVSGFYERHHHLLHRYGHKQQPISSCGEITMEPKKLFNTFIFYLFKTKNLFP